MFIIPASMITQATVPASSVRRASSAAALLNGTACKTCNLVSSVVRQTAAVIELLLAVTVIEFAPHFLGGCRRAKV